MSRLAALDYLVNMNPIFMGLRYGCECALAAGAGTVRSVGLATEQQDHFQVIWEESHTMTTTPDTPTVDDLTLAGDFDSPSMEQWYTEVAKVLNRGRPEDKQLSPEQAVARLRKTSEDGVSIEPLYTKEDSVELGYPGAAPFIRGTSVRRGNMDSWDVRVLHEDPDAKDTNKLLLADLERGASSVWLRVDPDALAPQDVKAALEGVDFKLAPVSVSSYTEQIAAADALLAAAGDVAGARLNLGLDPIGQAAVTGQAADLSKLADYAKKVAAMSDSEAGSAYETGAHSRAITIDGTIWHNAGAGDVHELAWELAAGVEYVRNLVEAGMSADDAFKVIEFRVSATTNQMRTIARLRALRFCWNRIGEVFGVSEKVRGAHQHAVTSRRQITRDDPYVNILRGTIACFSAAVAGAEAVTVLPFDTAWGLPNAFSRRVARNTQIVLAEESNIGRVNDPAGGAWAIESLTKEIADLAWKQLQTVEAAGGLAKYLADGKVEEALKELKAERAKRVATRKQPITGVSEFPNPGEAPVEGRKPRPKLEVKGLQFIRDSLPFEALRDATKGTDAKVFLAGLGTRRDFGAREGFASNYFHVAGLGTDLAEGGSVDEIVAAFKAAGTPVACLCSSRKVYGEQGIEVAKALKDAGAKKVILAGNIKELGDVATEGIIDDTIALGKDVVAGLNDILRILEVTK